MSEATVPSPTDAPAVPSPTLTVTVGSASVTVEVADTAKEGENFYKRHGALTLPLDAEGRCDPAQVEGALASLTVLLTRVESVVAQAWLAKQTSLRAERQRQRMVARLTTALQSICVPPADAETVLQEFLGGIPATPAEMQVTLAKVVAFRASGARPEGWRWKVPVAPKKPVPIVRRPAAAPARGPQAPAPAANPVERTPAQAQTARPA